jgi:8-oxo-dGTP pyrophosphatase MutT (NUDIX family)
MVKAPNKPKSLSAGVIVYDGKKFIIGHATGSKHWDIPKGKIEPNEVAIAAAIRELREETGIEADWRKLIHLGIFEYKRDKDLSLYLLKVDTLPPVKDLKCTSTFDNKHGKALPEFDKFAHVSFKTVGKKTVDAMTKVLKRVEASHHIRNR